MSAAASKAGSITYSQVPGFARALARISGVITGGVTVRADCSDMATS